jgi:5-hydroxyisourate hydrolase
MGISTHILDVARGRPAQGVAVVLSRHDGEGFREVARGVTNDDGRVKPLLESIPGPGVYRIAFDVAPYFSKHGTEAFFPSVSIDFVAKTAGEHYHVPLLLSPFGYSTYRGS